MVLREIFLTLETLLDLQYEKNTNGTYRVNTVIKELIYPAFYENKSFQDNEIGYYLKDTEYSYQGEPNIRNAFTELMRPKENSNRYPTTSFCDNIDINEMYTYYENLIQQGIKKDPDKLFKINEFIENILKSEEELKAKLQIICHKPNQYITWIVIFSMFNSQNAYGKYESYLKINTAEYSNFHLTESSSRYHISKYLQHKRRQLGLFTTTLVIANSLQLAYLVLPFILRNGSLQSPLSSISSCIALLMISVLLLVARFFHMNQTHKYSSLQTCYDNYDVNPDISDYLRNLKNCKPLSIKPFKITTQTHIKREQTRITLRVITGISLLISFVLSLLVQSLPFMLSVACLTCLLTMYADRYLNQRRYSCHYDSFDLPQGVKPNSLRGMAKIYRREYEITQFDFEHNYYYATSHIHSSKCFQHIFSMTYNRIYNFIIVTTIILMGFNIIILCVAILYQIVPAVYAYLRVTSETYFATFIVLFLIALSIINIIAVLNTHNNHMTLAQLAFASAYVQDDITYTERAFLHLQSQGKIKELDIARGIYSYSMEYIEKGLPLETIWPESDRILYIHRIPALKPWLFPMTWLICGTCFFLFVWHCGIYALTVPILSVTILADIFIDTIFLKYLDKKKYIRAIKNLQKQ